MPSIINSDDGVVSGTSGLKTTGGNDGLLNIQTNGSTAMSINASQQVTFNNGANLPNTFGFKNRIINGGMVIDQRNAGAAVTQTTTDVFPVDRFRILGSVTSKFTGQRSTVAPAGFTNSLLLTSSAATSLAAGDYYVCSQKVEGFNIADLGWGTANAVTVTLSFWVRSSLTGTFGGALLNNAANRSYPFTYTISAANTWEQKSVTIPGDTSGTWLTDNNVGVFVNFGLGVGTTYSGTAGAWAGSFFFSATGATSVVGTNGATFYITGVQLERGSTATSFDFRDYGRELIMCQRYYEASNAVYTLVNNTLTMFSFRVTKRAQPTVTLSAGGLSGGGYTGTDAFRCFGNGVDLNWTASIEL